RAGEPGPGGGTRTWGGPIWVNRPAQDWAAPPRFPNPPPPCCSSLELRQLASGAAKPSPFGRPGGTDIRPIESNLIASHARPKVGATQRVALFLQSDLSIRCPEFLPHCILDI